MTDTALPRYQAGDIIGETTTEGGRLVKVLHVGQEAYFVRHLGGLGAFDDMPNAEPLETAWGFEGCEAATYLHERPVDPRETPVTASEADAGEALWRRLTVPEKERRKLINTYRDAVLADAADRIRAEADTTCGADDPRWNGMNAAADLIQETT